MTVLTDLQPDAAAFRQALRQEALGAILLVDLDFLSKPVRLSNWNIRMTIDGQVYDATGALSRISEVGDAAKGSVPPLEYGLSVPTELLDNSDELYVLPEILSDASEYVGRKAELRLQIMAKGVAVGVPMTMHVGRMYKPRFVMSTTLVELSILSESIAVRRRVPGGGYLTAADQKVRHPTDEGLEFVSTAVSEPVDWLNS